MLYMHNQGATVSTTVNVYFKCSQVRDLGLGTYSKQLPA